VYGVRSEPRITEDLDLMPISDYNKTKMVAERVLLSYSDAMVVTIFRPATVCGFSPRMRLDLTVNGLTMQALSNRRMTVFGGEQDSHPRRRRGGRVDGVLPGRARVRRDDSRKERARRRPRSNVHVRGPSVRVRTSHLVLAWRPRESDQRDDRQADLQRALLHRSPSLHVHRIGSPEVPVSGPLPGRRADARA